MREHKKFLFCFLAALTLMTATQAVRFGDEVVSEDAAYAVPPDAPIPVLTITGTSGEPTLSMKMVMRNNCTASTGGVCNDLERDGFWVMSWSSNVSLASPDTCSNIHARGSTYGLGGSGPGGAYALADFTDVSKFPAAYDYSDAPTSLDFTSVLGQDADSVADPNYSTYEITGTINSFFTNCDSTWVSGQPWNTVFYMTYVENITSTVATYRTYTIEYVMNITQVQGAWIVSTSFNSELAASPTILSVLSQRDGSGNTATVTMRFAVTTANGNGQKDALRLISMALLNPATSSTLNSLNSPFDTTNSFPAMTDGVYDAGDMQKCSNAGTSCTQIWTVVMNVGGAVDASNYLRVAGTFQAGIEVYDQLTSLVTPIRTELVNMPLTLAIPPNTTTSFTVAIETSQFSATDSAGNVFDLTDADYKTFPNDMIEIDTRLVTPSLRSVYDIAARLLIVCLGVTANAQPVAFTTGLTTGCLGASSANRVFIYQNSTWLADHGYGSLFDNANDLSVQDTVKYSVSSEFDTDTRLQKLKFKNIFLSGTSQTYVYTAIYDIVPLGGGERRLMVQDFVAQDATRNIKNVVATQLTRSKRRTLAAAVKMSNGHPLFAVSGAPQSTANPMVNMLTVTTADCPPHSSYVSASLDCQCDALYVYNIATETCVLDDGTINSINKQTQDLLIGIGSAAGGVLVVCVVALAMIIHKLRRGSIVSSASSAPVASPAAPAAPTQMTMAAQPGGQLTATIAAPNVAPVVGAVGALSTAFTKTANTVKNFARQGLNVNVASQVQPVGSRPTGYKPRVGL
eukprot:GILJ01005700.1.p1 GENE.GILJ01005700.1~~GILJ01005700.1.p1  ORF type:complete len:798 (-),score=117.27 GILJ01005700.1:1176-3569(-)